MLHEGFLTRVVEPSTKEEEIITRVCHHEGVNFYSKGAFPTGLFSRVRKELEGQNLFVNASGYVPLSGMIDQDQPYVIGAGPVLVITDGIEDVDTKWLMNPDRDWLAPYVITTSMKSLNSAIRRTTSGGKPRPKRPVMDYDGSEFLPPEDADIFAKRDADWKAAERIKTIHRTALQNLFASIKVLYCFTKNLDPWRIYSLVSKFPSLTHKYGITDNPNMILEACFGGTI